MSTLAPAAFRRAMAAYTTGVTVVTTRARDGSLVGVTANSFNSVSLEPPLVLWSLRLNSYSFAQFRDAPGFAVSVLGADQRELCERFAVGGAEKFNGVALRSGAHGSPVLQGCLASFECEAEAMHVAGDHAIFIGRVLACTVAEDAPGPLIYGMGRLHSDASTLLPGPRRAAATC